MSVASEDPPNGGGLTPLVSTRRGGPDYGRFVDEVRTLQDLTRGVDAPDDVVTSAADLIAEVNRLLEPHLADELRAPSGRRFDLPNRGNIQSIPVDLHVTDDGQVAGTARFRRFHLGRNGAVHGGALAHMFDSLLGYTAYVLTTERRQRTASLRIDYRQVVPIEQELGVDARIVRTEGRKTVLTGRLRDGDTVLCEAEALFVALRPGQP